MEKVNTKKQNKVYRVTTRFTEQEMKLISKYAKKNGCRTIVSFVRECISSQINSAMADNIRLAKDASLY